MFRLTDDKGNMIDTSKLRAVVNRTNRNYLIQPNDYLQISVFTNKGELILDPNGELRFGQSGGSGRSGAGGATGGATRNNAGSGRTSGGNVGAGVSGGIPAENEFLVQTDGSVTVPLVGKTTLSGLTLLQADSVLQRVYAKYYEAPFVETRVTNNRVIMLGATGGRVIPLSNDNMNLLEVLALAGGTENSEGGVLYRFGGRVTNIRIIRGDLKNPQVQIVDLSTFEGMRRANLQMEPNDIVYIEPIRRPVFDAFADASPFLSSAALLLNITTVLITILR